MLQKLKKQSKGFTIIEVLIVLAIAGLIMLIVFLAVPALQRNSRNTQMKNSASAVLSAVTEFTNNNNGVLPTKLTAATDGTVTVGDSSVAGVSANTAKIQPGFTVTLGQGMPTKTGAIDVEIGSTCSGNAFASGGSSRAFAVGYLVEGGSANNTQCVQS